MMDDDDGDDDDGDDDDDDDGDGDDDGDDDDDAGCWRMMNIFGICGLMLDVSRRNRDFRTKRRYSWGKMMRIFGIFSVGLSTRTGDLATPGSVLWFFLFIFCMKLAYF